MSYHPSTADRYFCGDNHFHLFWHRKKLSFRLNLFSLEINNGRGEEKGGEFCKCHRSGETVRVRRGALFGSYFQKSGPWSLKMKQKNTKEGNQKCTHHLK